ncbi:nitrate- and nitrite sensing domain-containing protein [Actinophytocola sp.]|uniref:sensor histidine kinase n=1 Tax=Actinophytocola sp. TaxID=1872138 RepID=UPI002ED52598
MSSVEETGPDHTGRRGTWWSAVVQWRNWPLLVKLGVVLVVPVVSALVLGVLKVKADVDLAESYTATERVAELRAQFEPVLAGVERERAEALRAGGQFDEAVKATDKAVADLREIIRDNPDLGAAESGYAAVTRALNSLPAARNQVTVESGDALVVLSAYNAVINTVLEFDRSLVGRFPDENLASTSIALSELLGMRDQVTLRQAIGNLALRDRFLPNAARQLLIETDVRLDDKLDDFRSQAPSALEARYEDAAAADSIADFQQMVDAVRTVDPTVLPFNQEEWDTAGAASATMMSDLTRQAASDLRTDSNELSESIGDRAGLESVLLLLMVLLAAGVGGGLGRYLLRSVGMLRRTALDVANQRLPEAVASIRAGEGARVVIEPVPLRTTEEFGQLARAFDAVNDQAVRSATEEASLRSNLANIFTNLSRRSQGLVERQLRLMEQLEQKTEDPEQLENLFKIDHLATRMRRNNENLMVLSGTGLLRRFTEPMPLPDVLRAAISEVEHYQRAVVRSVPEVRVAGYAAGDLIRSVSELIENATAFSPPEAQVVVNSRMLEDGSAVIDILDEGVGMSDADLRDVNERIAGGGGVDVPISRQMGLFVVGRLTARHGIGVRLMRRGEAGLCVSVTVPPGLVTVAPGQTVTPSAPAETTSVPAVDWPVEIPGAAEATTRFQPVSPVLVGASHSPAEAFEPAAVSSRLETAGIVVSLPELPPATTPASILFAASTPVEDSGGEEAAGSQEPRRGFTWLQTSADGGSEDAAESAPQAPVVTTGPAGLPKRVPKGQLRAPARGQQPQQPATTRNAARAKGFLTGFQAGIRQSENRKGETGS